MRRKSQGEPPRLRASFSGSWSYRDARCSFPRFDQLAILRHVPYGLPGFAERLAQQPQIVETVREARVAVQRSFVGFHRLVPAVQILQQNAEVVEQQGIVAARRDCFAIDALRIGEATGFVQEPSQVDMRAQELRVAFEGALIRLPPGLCIGALQFASPLAPLLPTRPA